MEDKFYSLDGILWLVDKYNDTATPICPKDKIGLSSEDVIPDWDGVGLYTTELKCEDCGKTFKLSRALYNEKKYLVEKIKSLDRKDYAIIDLDGIQTPVTKKEKIDPENGYFCTAQIRNSKRGPQVVIYAGKKGLKEKSQVLVMPKERRLSFDQTDINPADIFTKITAEFCDGTKHTIKGGKNEK